MEKSGLIYTKLAYSLKGEIALSLLLLPADITYVSFSSYQGVNDWGQGPHRLLLVHFSVEARTALYRGRTDRCPCLSYYRNKCFCTWCGNTETPSHFTEGNWNAEKSKLLGQEPRTRKQGSWGCPQLPIFQVRAIVAPFQRHTFLAQKTWGYQIFSLLEMEAVLGEICWRRHFRVCCGSLEVPGGQRVRTVRGGLLVLTPVHRTPIHFVL